MWGRCGGLERTDFEQFLLLEGVVVLKELTLNSFHFGRCGSLERTDFEQFLLWKGVELGVLVLKELILNSFYFGTVWWSWKNSFWTVSSLAGCGGLERTDFEQFLLWEGCGGSSGGLERTDFEQFLLWDSVVVFKALILNNFYFGRVWWSWKNSFWTVSTLGGWGGLERTDFEQFLLWEGVVVLKEVILNSFYFGRVWWSWKNWF